MALAEFGELSGSRVPLMGVRGSSEERGVYDEDYGVMVEAWIYVTHDTPFSSGTSFEMAWYGHGHGLG